MSSQQIFALFLIERTEGGVPKQILPSGPTGVSGEKLYRRFLELAAGITDVGKQMAFWVRERQRRADRETKKKKSK